MKHRGQDLSYKSNRRRLSLDATGAGPLVKLGLALLALTLAVLLVVFVLVPAVSGRLDFSAMFAPSEKTPAPAAEATPPALLTAAAESFSLDTKHGENAFVDPDISGDTLIYASGASETDCDRLVTYDLASRKRQTYTPPRENDCLRMPRLCGSRIVYFDAKAEGGGSVCLFFPDTGSCTVLLTLSSGVPRLMCDGQYLLLRAATGEGAVKLYAFDLITYEAVTLALIEDAAYAASDPCIGDGVVSYALASETSADTARILSVNLATGETATLEAGVFAHDVKRLGERLLWLSGNHGENTDVYTAGGTDGEAPRCIAKGVIDAALCGDCAVYGRDGTVYAYAFFNGRTYMISGAEDYAQLAAAGGNYALWRVLENSGVSWRYLKVE